MIKSEALSSFNLYALIALHLTSAVLLSGCDPFSKKLALFTSTDGNAWIVSSGKVYHCSAGYSGMPPICGQAIIQASALSKAVLSDTADLNAKFWSLKKYKRENPGLTEEKYAAAIAEAKKTGRFILDYKGPPTQQLISSTKKRHPADWGIRLRAMGYEIDGEEPIAMELRAVLPGFGKKIKISKLLELRERSKRLKDLSIEKLVIQAENQGYEIIPGQ